MPEFTYQMLGNRSEVLASDAFRLMSQLRSLQNLQHPLAKGNLAIIQASCWDGLVQCAHSHWILKDVLESSVLGLAIAVRVGELDLEGCPGIL